MREGQRFPQRQWFRKNGLRRFGIERRKHKHADRF